MKRKEYAWLFTILYLFTCQNYILLAWNTEVLYPLIYRTGTWDLFINKITMFGSADILIGGKSFSTKAVGEGFIMRIDKYRKLLNIFLILFCMQIKIYYNNHYNLIFLNYFCSNV